jgi:hypothetical protein
MNKKTHGNKLSVDIVINQFKINNKNNYDYTKVIYVNDYTKVIITCPIHGDFEQTPSNHKRGQKCPKCSGRNLTNDEIIDEFKKIHDNKYQYGKTLIINTKTKVIITCPIHGDFEQTPNNHKRGQGCQKCYGKEVLTQLKAIELFEKSHGNKYDYAKVKYINAHTKVIITCPIHGDFEQTPNNHKNGNACPMCNESNGETKVRVYLTENNINFLQQHRFQDCKNKLPLPFDFYIPELNVCIEYNGLQHYKPIEYFGGINGFKERQINDKIKKGYCNNNNILLITIKYNENVTDKLHQIKVVK